ncbi:hypothetical protein [Streptomyces sp. ISL-100]|uniref:hypothetical protein n=1 Tax=Streptomyces sp. ISL-100 TaxID=2819173 RepID=UPI0035AC1A40
MTDLIHAGRLHAGDRLQLAYRQTTYTAELHASGALTVDGIPDRFTSLSAAAVAA